MGKDRFFYHAGRVILFMAFIAMLSGCAVLKEKFVRKKKEDRLQPKRYYVVRPYDVRPSIELYTKRYIFWKNWHRELLEVLDDSNQKKAKVAIEQEISNLIDMQRMLIDEKGDELQVIIVEMEGIQAVIKGEGVTRGNEVRLRRKLEALGREIKNKFSYRKMGSCIRGRFRDESEY